MLIDFRKLFPKYNIKPKGVLHIGANIGEEADVYYELGIDKAFFIEASTEIYIKLSDNLKKPQYKGRYVSILACIGESNYTGVIHIANNAGQSSSLLELGTHKIQHPDVHFIRDEKVVVRTMMDVWEQLKEHHVFTEKEFGEFDFLNIDIQGAELMALKGMGDLLRQFKWACLELNRGQVYQGCGEVESVDLFMISHGFRRVETKWVGNWGDGIYIR
jgi:FkbM family methyltransferase